jgi:nickel/cobalt exporter
MSATPALLLAAGGVGLGHALLPDHWLPLAVIGRTRRYSLARMARLSTLAGLAHVLVSLVLGGVIVAVGLQFRSSIQSAESAIVGSLLIATAVVLLVIDLTGVGHSHHGHSHSHGHSHAHGHSHGHGPEPTGSPSLIQIVVSFGAAASPDLTILPVFLAAAAAGAGAAVGSLIVFTLVTVATFVVLTLLATVGGYRICGEWLEKSGNLLTAGMLLILGVLVLTGVI